VAGDGAQSDTRTPGTLRLRLATLLFVQYFVWGVWFVSFGGWLGATLHFSGPQIGAVYGTLAIAGLITPMIGGVIADRLARTERMLALLFAAGAGLLASASAYREYNPLYSAVLLWAFTFLPTLALVPSLSMRHLRAPASEYPVLRTLGTVGWLAGGLLVGGLGVELTPIPLQVGAASSLLLAVYCLTLPATPPIAPTGQRSLRTLIGLDALSLLRDPLFVVFLCVNLALAVPNQLYNAFGALYLAERGLPHPAALLTLGQLSEVGVLLALPRLQRRLGARNVLMIGAAAWAVRCVLFALAGLGSLTTTVVGLLLHGFAYGCVYIAGMLVVHERAPAHLRASAQGFWAVMIMGVGNLGGAWIAGRAVGHYATATTHNWTAIWLIPAVVSAVATIGVIVTGMMRSNRMASSRA
jgi:nucleoside transporter